MRAWRWSVIAAGLAVVAEAAAAPSTPSATVATAGAAAAPKADDADVLAGVDRVAGEVAKLRGLKRKKPIARQVLGQDELRVRLAARASPADAAARSAEAIALERWGVLPIGTDYGALLVDVMTEQLAGFYDHDAHVLYVAAPSAPSAPAAGPPAPGEPDPASAATWVEMLLAHELDHALADQAFDLKKLFAAAADGDAIAARYALVEGDGMALMLEYVLAQKGQPAPWTDPDLAPMLLHTMDAEGPAGAKLGNAPLWVREELLFPYRAGIAFVASIRRRHPWSWVDAVYRRPPRSSAQVLHPELYDADEAPIPVTAGVPPSLSDSRTLWTDVWGEEKWATFLRAHCVDDAMAFTAAAGWAGDRVAVYARAGDDDPRHAVGVARTAWETDVDAQEATEALVRALDTFTGVAAERTDDGGRWTDAGRVSWVARRGREVVVVVGAPAPVASALADEVWTSWKAKLPRERQAPRSK